MFSKTGASLSAIRPSLTSVLCSFFLLTILSIPLTVHAIDTDADGSDDAIDNCPTMANPQQNDGDADAIGDLCDNCLTLANADQRDTNNDGFGNRCDADLNNDGAVNFADLGIMKSVFFTNDADADLDGNSAVNFAGLGILKSLFFSPPGPIAEPAITVTPTVLDLGDIFVGGSTTGYLTVSNNGTAPLDASSITVGGSFTVFAPTAFSIANGGADRIVNIGFAPVSDGTFTEILTINTNTSQAEAVTITGRGVLPIQPGDIQAITSLEFGQVEESATVEQVLTVRNTGTGPLALTGATTDDTASSVFTTAGESFPLSLNPGDSRNLLVTFAPLPGSAGISPTATLIIQSDDPDESNLAIALDGAVVATVAAVPNNPVVSTRIQFNPFDLITAATCSSVGGEVIFSTASSSADSYQVILTDQGGVSVSSAAFAMLGGAGTDTFSGISACSLSNGTISIKVIATVNGSVLPAFAGTPAVKNTSTLSAPVHDPLAPALYRSRWMHQLRISAWTYPCARIPAIH